MIPTSQVPHSLLMIRPASFGFNPQTAASNAFQQPVEGEVAAQARDEFDKMVIGLQAHEIAVTVVEDTPEPVKTDAVFPNNWFSTHGDGTVVLYPMESEMRRRERRPEVVERLRAQFQVEHVVDLTGYEQEDRYLEGTGSLVFDHAHRKVYACRSSRTNVALVEQLAQKLGYQAVVFQAFDAQGKAIYHTNVLMCIGQKFAVVCLEAIPEEDIDRVLDSLNQDGHQIIAISFWQMEGFAGNMLEVQNVHGEPYLLMSQAAFERLVPGQVNAIGEFAEPLPIQIPTIEKVGGGSVRCMVAGIHLPKK
jgi:hypothetical protein